MSSRRAEELQAYRFQPMLNERIAGLLQLRARQEATAPRQAIRAWLANENDGAAADRSKADPLEVGHTRTAASPPC
jgi:hypothetical protein